MAGNALMKILVSLGLDTSDFDKKLPEANRKAQQFGRDLQSIGASTAKFGANMSAAVTLPIMAAGAGITSLASDMAESINAVNVVFGEASDIILDYSKNSATAVGLSTTEFNKLSTTTGAFLQNVGFDAATAAEETISLTERAADMASVFNTDVSTALEAIQSGLKGEFNPLERFAVKINAATVEAKALEMGLAGSAKELTDSHKSAATLALIYEQTAKVQGDFANTSDGLANSTRIAKAEFLNAAAALGTKLLPYAVKLMQAISQLITWFTNLSPAAQNTILIIAAIAAAIGPLLVVLGSLLGAIGTITAFLAGPTAAAIGAALAAAAPIIGVIVAIIAVIGLLYVAWTNNWGGIRDFTAQVTETIKGIFAKFTAGWSMLMDAFKLAQEGKWYEFGAKIREIWDATWRAVNDAFMAAKQWLLDTAANIINGIINAFTSTNWGEVGSNIIAGIADAIAEGKSALINAAIAVAKAALGAFKGFLGIKSPSKVFAGVGNNIAAGLAKGMLQGEGLVETAAEHLSVSGVSAAYGAGGSPVTNNTYNIFSKEQPGQIQNALSLAALRGGAA